LALWISRPDYPEPAGFDGDAGLDAGVGVADVVHRQRPVDRPVLTLDVHGLSSTAPCQLQPIDGRLGDLTGQP